MRTLAAVVAHPDDDAYGISSLVALHADDPGFRFVLIHATDGEAGLIAEGSGATRETLGAIRREEDRRAWMALGRGHPVIEALEDSQTSCRRPTHRRNFLGGIRQSRVP